MWSLLSFIWNVVPWIAFFWFSGTFIWGIAAGMEGQDHDLNINYKKYSGLGLGIKTGTWLKGAA